MDIITIILCISTIIFLGFFLFIFKKLLDKIEEYKTEVKYLRSIVNQTITKLDINEDKLNKILKEKETKNRSLYFQGFNNGLKKGKEKWLNNVKNARFIIL